MGLEPIQEPTSLTPIGGAAGAFAHGLVTGPTSARVARRAQGSHPPPHVLGYLPGLMALSDNLV